MKKKSEEQMRCYSGFSANCYTRSAILPAIDQLGNAGVLVHEKMRPGHRGMQSRFCAPPDLLGEMAKVPIVYGPLEIIIVRDANGNPVDYCDNRQTRTMRRRLEILNEGLIDQNIGLDGQTVREGDRLDNGRAQVRMHRVFNRSNFESGGRVSCRNWPEQPGRYQT